LDVANALRNWHKYKGDRRSHLQRIRLSAFLRWDVVESTGDRVGLDNETDQAVSDRDKLSLKSPKTAPLDSYYSPNYPVPANA
jgi:hypothetical protein